MVLGAWSCCCAPPARRLCSCSSRSTRSATRLSQTRRSRSHRARSRRRRLGRARRRCCWSATTSAAHKYYRGAVPHSNEMLLVRIDPSKPWISMMSIPRELWVPINTPNGSRRHHPPERRLHAAASRCSCQTIKQVTGLSVNHVVVITSAASSSAVNEIGCVYSTVDPRYYHVNVPGGQQYQQINLQPGYQRLCGSEALAVRLLPPQRHLAGARRARPGFLLDVKRQYGPTLLEQRPQVRADLRPDRPDRRRAAQPDWDPQPARPADLRRRSARPPGSVPGRAVGPTCACDTATPQQIQASVHSFLFGGQPLAEAAARRRRRRPSSTARCSRSSRWRRRSRRASPPSKPAAAASPFTRSSQGPVPAEPRIPSRAVHAGNAAVPARLPDPCPGRRRVPGLRGGVLRRPARPVLRRAGDDLDQRAAVREPRPDGPRRRPDLLPLLRRHVSADRRVARGRRRLLGPQHAQRRTSATASCWRSPSRPRRSRAPGRRRSRAAQPEGGRGAPAAESPAKTATLRETIGGDRRAS